MFRYDPFFFLCWSRTVVYSRVYYALFTKVNGKLFRLDTQIYLNESDQPRAEDTCVAAVVAKNPGSAVPRNLGVFERLQLNEDKMLPRVRNDFIAAYEEAGKEIPEGGFVRVWNLFYLCGQDLRAAISSYSGIQTPLFCQSEKDHPSLVWFVWGRSHRILDLMKLRFAGLTVSHPCFYDWVNRVMKEGVPRTCDFAKHPQGLLRSEVVPFLAARL
jgi:hypothetical protein